MAGAEGEEDVGLLDEDDDDEEDEDEEDEEDEGGEDEDGEGVDVVEEGSEVEVAGVAGADELEVGEELEPPPQAAQHISVVAATIRALRIARLHSLSAFE